MTALSPNKKYFLLLIDLKKSTSISSSALQKSFKKLERLLAELNMSVCPKPVIPLTISYGDEIAGLFNSPKRVYYLVSQIREALYPEISFRFVALHGKIGVASDDIRKIGGPIFKQADEHLKRLKRQDLFCHWSLRGPEQDAVLTSLTEMSNILLARMTPYQRSVYRLLNAGLSQKEITIMLKKYPQSVSNAVKRGAAEQVLKAEQLIGAILAKI